MSKSKYKQRDITRTANLTNCDIAKLFYEEKNVHENFGGLISNDDFNQWIFGLKFEGMDQKEWASVSDKKLWNGHRKVVRGYIKNGIMTKEYCKTGYAPYCLEVKQKGQSLIITKFSDLIIDNYKSLSKDRMANIKNKDKSLRRDYKALTETYNIKPIKAIIQEGIITAQNQMRYGVEEICGKIVTNTMTDIMKSIETQEREIKKITNNIVDHDD